MSEIENVFELDSLDGCKDKKATIGWLAQYAVGSMQKFKEKSNFQVQENKRGNVKIISTFWEKWAVKIVAWF